MPPVNEAMSELRAIHLPSDARIGVGEIFLPSLSASLRLLSLANCGRS